MRRILVTGAGTWTGGRLVQRLEHRAGVEVRAVDEVAPRLDFSSGFRRVGLDRPELARYLLQSRPETVIHLQSFERGAEVGRSRAHEEVVVGAQALFGAIGRCETVRHVIVASDVAVYGTGPRNPSVLTEESTGPAGADGYRRDLLEMEQFVGGTAEHHPDVTFTVLRFAGVFGPSVANPLSRYLRLPVVPTLLGFDPRLQVVFEDDAVRALEHVIDHPAPGTFNVAAPGQLYLSRILRLGRRIPQPLPRRAFEVAVRGMARLDVSLPAHLMGHLKHGMVVDTTRMRQVLGFSPRLATREAVLAGYRRIEVGTEGAP
jgi:UDP-glucose 4-epimerase